MNSSPSSFDVVITVRSAAGLAKKDVFGLCDPYVKIALIQDGEATWKVRTPTFEKSLNPKWDKTYIVRVDASRAEDSKIVFNVFDANRLTRDDFLGRVEIPVKSIPSCSSSDAVEERFELQQRTHKSTVSGYLSLIIFCLHDRGSRTDDDVIRSPNRPWPTTPEQGSPVVGSRSPRTGTGEQQPVTSWHSTSRHELPLPANWEERIDNLGRRYYVNHTARVMQYRRPVSNDQQQPAFIEEQRRQEAELTYRRRHQASQGNPDTPHLGEELQPSQSHTQQLLQQQRQQVSQEQDQLLQSTVADNVEQGAAVASTTASAPPTASTLVPSAPQEDEIFLNGIHSNTSPAVAPAAESVLATIDTDTVPGRPVASAPSAADLMITTLTAPSAVLQPPRAAALSGERLPSEASATLPAALAVAVSSAPNDVPLPSGWVQLLSPSGRIFFMDHNTRTTTWNDPRLPISPTSPTSSAAQKRSLLTSRDPTRQLGPLPAGWQEVVHTNGRKFYINHDTRKTQWEDPRLNKRRAAAVEYSVVYQRKLQHFRSRLDNPRGGLQLYEFSISRSDILEDSFREIMTVTNINTLKSQLIIRFKGERGIDAGGLSREWFFLVSREIFNPYYGLFEYSAIDNYTLQINNQSGMANSNHLEYFHFLGRVMGMAAYHNKLLDGFFILPLYKLMLKKPITVEDMESVDLEYYNSLKWIMDNDIQAADLEMTFSIENERYGKMLEVELKPRGKEIKVTNENKAEYVRLVIKWRFEDSIKMQLNAMMKGFNEIVPQSAIALFDENELELLLCGVQDIDVDEWKANTIYKGDYSANHPTIVNFWRMVYSLDNEGRARLLQFSTGTSRVPANGFAELYGSCGPAKFCIEKVGSPHRLPRSHTCFNRLDLPPYETYEELRQKVLMALECTEGFDGVD